MAVSAVRFLYHVTLKQNQVMETIPYPKKEDRLPVILSPEEVLRLLEAAVCSGLAQLGFKQRAHRPSGSCSFPRLGPA